MDLHGSDAYWEERWQALDHRFELPLRGLRELEEVRASLNRLERMFVAVARSNYSSWAEIGSALGISRQAARDRHRSVCQGGRRGLTPPAT